jgi:phage tail sheath protein FI
MQLPASTMALGAFAQSDSKAYVWTAPAGYNRTVVPATNLSTLLLDENVNTIYDAGINPFISTPSSLDSTGSIIINGQRTLLVEGSALDRINVRRLLIEVRRRVKAVAYSLLFEPNRESTIARFNSAVTPIMKQIQSQRGVERYRVQIDATTTTQADIENNTIRGKIYLQPTKAVEFVSIDFEAKNAADF